MKSRTNRPDEQSGSRPEVEHGREERFIQSLRDWGEVFMHTIWLQSIMISAILTKVTGESKRGDVLSEKYLSIRYDLMKKPFSKIWDRFVCEFPGELSKEEALTVDMIVLIRNQIAHCCIMSGKERAFFLPTVSKSLLDNLSKAGWVRTPSEDASEYLVMREGDEEWFRDNRAMILDFIENTVIRLTRANGIHDSEVY